MSEDGKQETENKEEVKPISIIEEAKKEREATEKVLEEIKKQKAELELMHARMIMGGSARAGQEPPKPKTEDDIAQEMADNVVKKIWGRL